MSVQISTITQRALTLTNMPPELICCIVDNMLEMNHDCEKATLWEWDSWTQAEPKLNPRQRYQDALNLAATCKDFSHLLTSQIYRYDVRHNKSSALLISTKRNNMAGVKRSLDAGANINTGDTTESMKCYPRRANPAGEPRLGVLSPLNLEKEVTALHWAAFKGHKDIAALLLDRGADINHRVSIETVLWWVRRSGMLVSVGKEGEPCMAKYPVDFSTRAVVTNAMVAQEALEGVDRCYRKMVIEHGANPLYFAVQSGNCDMADFLIKSGASLITHTGTNVHALHQAVGNCDLDMVKFLLQDNSIDVNVMDCREATPIHHIETFESYSEETVSDACEIIRTLVQHGAFINSLNAYGMSPLHEHLIQDGNMTVVNEFIRQGSHVFENFYEMIGEDPERLPDEMEKAFEDAAAKGFPYIVDFDARVNPWYHAIWASEVVRKMNRHFYKLVEQTDEVPEFLMDYYPSEWMEHWEERPFVFTEKPSLGGLSTFKDLDVTFFNGIPDDVNDDNDNDNDNDNDDNNNDNNDVDDDAGNDLGRDAFNAIADDGPVDMGEKI